MALPDFKSFYKDSVKTVTLSQRQMQFANAVTDLHLPRTLVYDKLSVSASREVSRHMEIGQKWLSYGKRKN